MRSCLNLGYKVIIECDIPYGILQRPYDNFSKAQEQTFCAKLAQLAKLSEEIVIRLWCGEGQLRRLKKYLTDLRFVIPCTPYQWVYPRSYLKVFMVFNIYVCKLIYIKDKWSNSYQTEPILYCCSKKGSCKQLELEWCSN